MSVEKILNEDWSEYDDRKKKGQDSHFFSCEEDWEVEYLVTTGVFSNLELLRMFSVLTPQTIFPKRKIAQFKNGYEASFIVVKNDPLIDIMNAKDIYFAFKQGTVLKNIKL